MTGTKEIEGGATKMVVLGGHFEMGDFYDYRNDRIVTGRKCWDSKEIAGATWKDNRFTLKLKSPETGSTKNKWENMGLKEHSQVSIMAGLIENHRGAAKYLNDRDGLSEASQVLICRVKSRKLKLDFKTLISQDVPHLQDLGQETQSEKNPTHVVVGVTYGAEAYCVLALESDENARKDAEEFLSKIARKMEEALDNYLDLSDFKEQFDKEDKTQLTRVKCRMYADLHTSAFRECGVFEAYKQCYKIIQQVQNTEGGSNESIPIAIFLCPLKAILGQIEGKQFEYHDVDSEVVARCGLIWNELDRIWAKSVAFRDINKKADNVSFRQFEETITKYKELMQKSLKNELTKARKSGRQYEIEKVINIAENHPIFNPSRLQLWLQYQQAECKMYDKISSITNIVCLSSKKQLEMELQNLFDAEYTLVLSVPLLDERMNGILEAMKNYVDSKLVYMKEDPNADAKRSVEADCEGSDDLGHGIQRKQKYVLAKIQAFTDYVEKNKHLENIVQFFIVFRQSVVEFGCRYSVYETGRLLRDNLNQLPRPPTGLRIRPPKTRPAKKTASTYAIDLEWDYEDLGFPCHFLVEYRLDGNKDEVWTQRKTTKSGETQLAIPYTSGSAMTIRVAADTCIGRSEFSEVVDTVTVRELNEDEEAILYTDLQTGVAQECSVPDVYKHFLKFIQQVQKTGIGNNKSIPIAVSLCPLQAITEHDEGGQFEFHDVDPELISRCARIWDELDQVCAKSVVIRTVNKKIDKSSLRQFEEAVGKYKSLMQTSLKKGIAKARETGQQSEIKKAATITENHSIFKPSQLVQWLLYKQGECEMYEKISKMAKNLPLASKKTVEKQLGEAFEIKYTVVLSLPCLEQRTNKILRALKDYTEKYNTLVTYDDEENETDDNVEEDSNMPWNQQTQKYVLSKVREFAEHVEKNKHLENQVQFFMNFCETDKDVGCRYSVYDATRLLKDNISQLPKPPTGLRVHAPKTSNPPKKDIVLAWDYTELGFPCYFLVEYRPCDGNDETWTQKKTTKPRETQITIPYKTRSAIEFRVAADTCIGRSEFSEVINTESEWDAVDDEETSSDTVSTYSEAGTADIRQRSEMRKTGTAASLQTSQSLTKNIRAAIKPPTNVEVETVTQSTTELGWVTSATENKSISYRVRYWQYGQDESQANELEVAVGESGCRLEGLLPETTYNINIVAVSNGGREMSDPSETLHLTTLHQHVRFAEIMVKCGIKIGDRNGMNLLAVPLTKSPRSNSTVERFAFGKESGSRTVLHKTILVMGATGAGKTTLINGMINYIFNVEWEDTFRFQLIHEQLVGSSQSQSQTSGITAYDIHHAEGFRVPYSLTIVDTPGYGDTKGLVQDKEITEMIRKFFEDKRGIQNLDIIGFVAQAPLPRLTPTQIYIFDSVLSIFGNDVEENIDFLLTFADGQDPPILDAIDAAGLPYPKEPGTGLPRHHKFNNSGFFCSNRESGSDASNTAISCELNRIMWRMGMKNFQRFFSTLAAMKTKSLSLTKQVLEERRRLKATVEGLQPLIKIGLTKMDEMRKMKQVITNNENQPNKWEFNAVFAMRKKATSSDAIKEKYEAEMNRKLTAQQLVEVLERDVMKNDKEVLQQVVTVTQCIKRLEEIALRPNPFSTPQYIDLIIDSEQQEKRQGYKERIESLKKLRKMAVITSKIKNKENLMSLDRKDDYEA